MGALILALVSQVVICLEGVREYILYKSKVSMNFSIDRLAAILAC